MNAQSQYIAVGDISPGPALTIFGAAVGALLANKKKNKEFFLYMIMGAVGGAVASSIFSTKLLP